MPLGRIRAGFSDHFLYSKGMLGVRYKIDQVLEQSMEYRKGNILEEVWSKERYNEKLKNLMRLKKKIDEMIKEVM